MGRWEAGQGQERCGGPGMDECQCSGRTGAGQGRTGAGQAQDGGGQWQDNGRIGASSAAGQVSDGS